MSALPLIVPRSLAPAGTLAGDWLRGASDLLDLLPPGRPRTGGRGALGGEPGRAGDPVRVGDAVLPASGTLPVSAFGVSGEAAAEKLARILAGEGGLVTTGQQPVLLLGPLLVLYKALTAIALAGHLEAESGSPHLACFWVASDDHDWPEIGLTRLLDRENDLRELRLEPPTGWSGRPVGRTPLPESIDSHIETLSELLPNSEFVSAYLTLIHATWRPGTPIGPAFGEALSATLAPRELAWIDSASAAVKNASAPTVRWALEEAMALEEALEGGARALGAAGHDPPIPLLPEATLVFLDGGTSRERLYRDGSGFRAGRGGPRVERSELLARLEASPGDFSPNVALRPLLETALLPVAVTVLGPGEIGYWTQLGRLFRAAGLAPPPIRPRAGWTLIEGKVGKVLEKLSLDPDDLADGGIEARARVTRSARPAAVEEALGSLRASLGRELDAVERSVADALPGIRSAVGKARAEAFRAIGELEAQVDARVREREEVLLGQLDKAALHLFPAGKPQERVISPFYYLARYGPELLAGLERETRERVAGHGERR